MPDLATLIRHYYDAAAEPVEVEEIFEWGDPAPSPVRPESTPGWLRQHPAAVVAVAALLTVLAIGGVLLLALGDSEGPVVTDPATTTVPAPSTTIPSPTTETPAPPTTQAASTTTQAASTTILPPPAPGETWGRVGPDSEYAFFRDAVDTGSQIVVVGINEALWPIEAEIWTSSHGAAWERVDGGNLPGLMESVAAAGDLVVSVGWEIAELPLEWSEDRPKVWRSEDGGTSWESIELDPEVFGSGYVWRVTTGGPGFVAAGRLCVGEVTDPEQVEAGLLADCRTSRVVIWSSADGGDWSRIWEGEDTGGNAGIYDLRITESGAGIVAGSWGSDAAVWISGDGAAWERRIVGSVPRKTLVATAVVPGGPGWVAVGWEGGPSAMERLGRVWTSPDGLTWTPVSDLPDAAGIRFWDLTVLDGRLFAVGSVLSGGEPAETDPVVWWSDDGMAWTPAGIDPEGSIRAVAATRDGLVAVGTGFAGEKGAVWVSPPTG